MMVDPQAGPKTGSAKMHRTGAERFSGPVIMDSVTAKIMLG